MLGKEEKDHYPDHIDAIENVFPEYYVLKVQQFDLKIRNTLDEWMYALRESEIKPEFKAKGIQKAAEALDVLQLSDIEHRRYERHTHDARVELSVSQTYYSEGKAEGLAEGKAEGIAEGEAKREAEIIFSMHAEGLSISQITKFVKLSEEYVERVQKNDFLDTGWRL